MRFQEKIRLENFGGKGRFGQGSFGQIKELCSHMKYPFFIYQIIFQN
jgi:hypothetical protein